MDSGLVPLMDRYLDPDFQMDWNLGCGLVGQTDWNSGRSLGLCSKMDWNSGSSLGSYS